MVVIHQQIHPANELVFAPDYAGAPIITSALPDLRWSHGQDAGRSATERCVDAPLRPVSYASAKRAVDIAVSIAAMILLLPLFLMVAALVKLTSRGPIVFKQVRVGEGGRTFVFYKFRSMYADAEAHQAELLQFNEVTGPVFKIKNDPRITPLGHVLRRFSLDELPQFFNVLKGDMSLVGPRPPLPREVMAYGPMEIERLTVRPGLTCLWQISGRSNVQFDRWMELDRQYIHSMSFWGDLRIMFKTIPAVLGARGAH